MQLNEVTQHKVDYYSGDDLLKVFKEKKNLPRFSNLKMIKEIIKYAKLYSVCWSKYHYQFVKSHF